MANDKPNARKNESGSHCMHPLRRGQPHCHACNDSDKGLDIVVNANGSWCQAPLGKNDEQEGKEGGTRHNIGQLGRGFNVEIY